jgi:hypothetical protein
LSENLSLDAIGILEGTNKSSLLVDFLRHYDRLFAPFRDQPITIIEIGLANGASLRTWARFFPKAKIVGLDIQDKRTQLANDRFIIEVGDQSDIGFLTTICEKYRPNILIDDGSHVARDVMLTFHTIFPSLVPGGIYIMEDLYLHYGENAKIYNKDSSITPSEYFFKVGHNLIANSIDASDNFGYRKYLFLQIDRIEIIRNALVVCKKEIQDTAKVHSDWRSLVERSNHFDNWNMLWKKLMSGGASMDTVAETLRRCIKFDQSGLVFHYVLAEVLDRMGNTGDAISEARRAVELSKLPKNAAQMAASQRLLDVLTAKAGSGSGRGSSPNG